MCSSIMSKVEFISPLLKSIFENPALILCSYPKMYYLEFIYSIYIYICIYIHPLNWSQEINSGLKWVIKWNKNSFWQKINKINMWHGHKVTQLIFLKAELMPSTSVFTYLFAHFLCLFKNYLFCAKYFVCIL